MSAYPRRFSPAQRAALYIAADGCCERCGTELDAGWHGDHVHPHVRGGPTALDNGQALCPPCNLAKGAQMEYQDSFRPRPFQAQVIDRVLDQHAAGTRQTVVLASPGAGKTITSQAVACELYRAGVIDNVLVLVPRITLAEQYETTWRVAAVREPDPTNPDHWAGDHRLFDARKRIGAITHTPNRMPLLPPGARGRGVVATYSSVVSAHGQSVFEDFAQRHAGRFLLVADEAQFCGAGEDGTRAGHMVEMLAHYAAHTLLMTGTPYRSDGVPLVLAEYGPVNADGLRPLLDDVKSTYQDGVREGYLRKFEATFIDALARRRDLTVNTVTEYKVSDDGSDLNGVLRQPEVWQPIVDTLVGAVRDKQRHHPDHRGLISCMEQGEAKQVRDYLTRTYPGLRVSLAISEDDAANASLAAFRTQPADVLVTVRMAFIGYDCKAITAVGVLTNYRDPGHLMQLVGRGLRAWDKTPFDVQSCRIIAPDDPKMQEFVKVMREELDQGLRERAEREIDEDRETAAAAGEATSQLTFIESATATGVRKVSNDVDLDAAATARLQGLADQFGIAEDLTKLHGFLNAWSATDRADGGHVPGPREEDVPAPVPVRTEKQRKEDYARETSSILKATLAASGVAVDDPSYGDQMQAITKEVNRMAGVSSAKAVTEEHHRQRRDAAQRLRAEW